jgi:hypothetical protein
MYHKSYLRYVTYNKDNIYFNSILPISIFNCPECGCVQKLFEVNETRYCPGCKCYLERKLYNLLDSIYVGTGGKMSARRLDKSTQKEDKIYLLEGKSVRYTKDGVVNNYQIERKKKMDKKDELNNEMRKLLDIQKIHGRLEEAFCKNEAQRWSCVINGNSVCIDDEDMVKELLGQAYLASKKLWAKKLKLVGELTKKVANELDVFDEPNKLSTK